MTEIIIAAIGILTILSLVYIAYWETYKKSHVYTQKRWQRCEVCGYFWVLSRSRKYFEHCPNPNCRRLHVVTVGSVLDKASISRWEITAYNKWIRKRSQE